MQYFSAALIAALLSLPPLQVKRSASMSIQSMDACTGLRDEECCEQALKIAGFRASGDHLSRKVAVTARLSCMSKDRVVPKGACMTIATSRGLPHTDVKDMCAPATVRKACSAHGDCRRCDKDLRRLDYKNATSACHAVTHTPAADRRPGVLVLRKGSQDGSGVEVTRRRTVLR